MSISDRAGLEAEWDMTTGNYNTRQYVLWGQGLGGAQNMCYQMPLTQLPDALMFSGSRNWKNKVRYKALYLGWNFYSLWSAGSGMQPRQAPDTAVQEHTTIHKACPRLPERSLSPPSFCWWSLCPWLDRPTGPETLHRLYEISLLRT